MQSEFSSKVDAWCSEANELDGRIQHCSKLIASMTAVMDGSASTNSCSSSDLLTRGDRAAKLGKQTRQPKSKEDNGSSAVDSTGI